MFKNNQPKKKYRFEGAVEKVRVLHSEIIHGIFEEVIRPVMRRNNWSMKWGMGSVMFFNAIGEEIRAASSGEEGVNEGSEIIQKLEEELGDIFGDLPAFGKEEDDGQSLWWLMSALYPNGKYENDVLSPWED